MARFDKLELNSGEVKRETEAAVAATSAARDEAHWLSEADKERRAGHFENALRYYSRALEIDRSIIGGWVGQVQMLVVLGECPEADLWSRKALELFPGNGELFAGRAQALCRTGDLKQAQELSDGALTREGESAYRWMVRGELMLARRQKAVEYCFQKAISMDADWLIPLEIAAILRHYDAQAQAVNYLRLALQKASDQPYPWYVLGLCQAEMEMRTAAVRSFERCLDACPGHEDARREIAAISNRGFSLTRWLRSFW